jgi:hypothetical protein
MHIDRDRQTDLKRYCRNVNIPENMKPSNLLPGFCFAGIIQDRCFPVVFVWDLSLFPVTERLL